MEAMDQLLEPLRTTFASGATMPLAWRVEQLTRLRRLLVESEEDISAAVAADLARPRPEAYLESGYVVMDVDFALEHVREWMADEWVTHPAMVQPGSSKISKKPRGVALIIAPFNGPATLSFSPLVAALAAGCVAVIKPSEMTPQTALAVKRAVEKHFDPSVVRVVLGGVPETTALLAQKWDIVFYTGNTAVGRIVYEAAAKNLTPVVLELGGKSPVYVSDDAKLSIACRRVAGTKFLNAGQVCIAPDYVLVHNSVKQKFIQGVKENILQMYGEDCLTKQSKDMARIVNARHFDRVVSMLNEAHGGHVVMGGSAAADRERLFVPPTIVVDPKPQSRLLTEEIFGPVLVVVGVDSMHDAIRRINSGPEPLAAYIFSERSATIDWFLEHTNSGGVCVNDCAMQLANPYLPFGGVGSAGLGNYHGKFGFDAFTHSRAVMYKSTWIDVPRYPPYPSNVVPWLKWFIAGPIVPPRVVRAVAAVGVVVGVASFVSSVRSSSSSGKPSSSSSS